jgi:hypothetical protein
MAATDGRKQAMNRTIEEFRGFISCLVGAKEKGIIYGTGAWQMGDINGSPVCSRHLKWGKLSKTEKLIRKIRNV